MRSLAILLALAASWLLPAAEPTEIESQRYLVKAYDERCRLLVTGELDLRVAEPDESGTRRVTGYRTFDPQVDEAYPFRITPRELIGRIEDDTIRLNLDRNVFDSNTYVRGRMIDLPEPGFEGIWRYSGWGLGPAGRIIAARAPAEPTKPCEDLPQPVTAEEIQEEMSELIRSMEDGMRPLPKREEDRRSAPAQDDERDGNEDEKDGGSQDFWKPAG
jgi:hypothetical protein